MNAEWTTGAGERGGHQEVVAHDMAHKANDWRAYHVQKLGMEALDAELEKAHACWVQAYQDLEEAKLWVWQAKRELEDLEKTLLSEMDETKVQAVFAGVKSTQKERDARRQAMMEQNPRFQGKTRELLDGQTAQRKAQIAYDIAEEDRKRLRAKIGWRQTMIDFWRTVARVPMAYAPDQDGVTPEVSQPVITQTVVTQRTGSVHDIPQVYDEESTAQWLRNMESDLVRYSAGGKLALQVLPAGVNPDDPRVIAIREDIRAHFEQKDRKL